MRSLLFVLIAAALATAPARAATLDEALAAAMAGKATPGMAVLTLRNFKVEAQAQRGVRRLGQSAPPSPEDLWHLGSDGKAITATMVARLVEQGRLSWTATLGEMLPDMAAEMRPEYRTVTLLDVMSHRAGLGELDDKDPLFQAAYVDRASPTDQRRAWVRRFLSAPPVGPIRGPNKYSNEGFILAGYLAERATGRSYVDLVRREVFAPLGMRTPTTTFPGPRELVGHVDGHVETPHDANPSFLDPAGGWRMSLADWATFCLDQMEGERGHGRLLKPATYRLLHTAQGETKAALGWGSVSTVLGRQGPALTHSGSDGNWYALVVLFPATGSGALVTANAAESMGADKSSSAAIRAVVETLSGPAP